MLTGEGGTCRDESFVSGGEVADQDIEMHEGPCRGAVRGLPSAAVPRSESRPPYGSGSSVTQPGYHWTAFRPGARPIDQFDRIANLLPTSGGIRGTAIAEST